MANERTRIPNIPDRDMVKWTCPESHPPATFTDPETALAHRRIVHGEIVRGSRARPSWTAATRPQWWLDDWRHAWRRMTYAGLCVVCHTRTYTHDDGEDDPRGILGDYAASELIAADYDMSGPDVPFCFMCANDEPRYRRGLEIAKRRWTPDPVAEARTEEESRKREAAYAAETAATMCDYCGQRGHRRGLCPTLDTPCAVQGCGHGGRWHDGGGDCSYDPETTGDHVRRCDAPAHTFTVDPLARCATCGHEYRDHFQGNARADCAQCPSGPTFHTFRPAAVPA